MNARRFATMLDQIALNHAETSRPDNQNQRPAGTPRLAGSLAPHVREVGV